MLTVKQLRAIIQNLPDDTMVVTDAGYGGLDLADDVKTEEVYQTFEELGFFVTEEGLAHARDKSSGSIAKPVDQNVE